MAVSIEDKRSRARAWYSENPEYRERKRAYLRAWRAENKPERKKRHSTPEQLARKREWYRKRRADPVFRERERERNRERLRDPQFREKERARKRALASARRCAGDWRTKGGITVLERDTALAIQGGVCAICGTSTPGGHNWNADHCHTTGKFRGVLCWPCNVALGKFKDDPNLLRRAANYVERGGFLE